MTAAVRIVAGPAKSGKTHLLLGEFRAHLASGQLGNALWLAPNRRSAAAVREALLGDGLRACFTPNCLTFAEFAETVVNASPLVMRRTTPLIERQLLRRAIDEVRGGKAGLEYFGPIADTPGMLDLLGRFVRELKRLEIWPDQFLAACRQRGMGAKDEELHRLYERYQLLLNRHQLYDREGKFWSARELLAKGQRRPWADLRHIYVDGFTDFTRTENEILEILAGRAESLTITLPLESSEARRDLFAKPRRSLEELRRRHSNLRVEQLERGTATAWQGMAHLEARLFGNPREAQPAADTVGIEIIATAGQTGELEAIAGRIKRLLTQGDPTSAGKSKGARNGSRPVRPHEIVVVVRSLSESASLVREVFREWGIPCTLSVGEKLDRAPALRALMTLLRLHQEDWPFRPLLSFLASNYFRPRWPEWRGGQAGRAAEYVVRQAQIPSGRAGLLSLVERWAAELESLAARDPAAAAEAEFDNSRQKRARRALQALPLLQHLDAALARLPRRANAGGWRRALEELALDVGILPAEQRGGPPVAEASDISPDTAAWQRLAAALEELETLAGWLEEASPQLSLSELFDRLSDALHHEALPAEHDEAGRVRVLEAQDARNLSAPYVFLAGLAEKSFPPAEREDRMYGEAETARLIEAGLPLVARAERSQEEMLLFYEAITRATRRLYLSYSALDSKGQTLSPSPYLTEVERACGEAKDGQPGRISRSQEIDLTPVPRSENVLAERDWRVKAVASALDGDRALLAGLAGDGACLAGENILAALRVVYARSRGHSPFEGVLSGDAALKKLAARFGPDCLWSTSQLEQYAMCPHQFMLDRVLRLEELPELSLDVDYLMRGRALHVVLAELHQRLNARAGMPSLPSIQSEAEFLLEFDDILGAYFDRVQSGQPVEAAMREIDRRRLAGWMARYREQHAQYDEHWTECDTPLAPTYFEVSFGLALHEAPAEDGDADRGDGISTSKPFELACGSETVRLVGRIDRIDVGVVAGQPVFNIIDYKSGRAGKRLNADAIQDGNALQLPLYALAVEQLLLADRSAAPMSAAYWYVQSQGYKEMLAFHAFNDGRLEPSQNWSQLRPKLLARVAALIEDLRRGQFPPTSSDPECTSHCPFNTVCRVNQVRSRDRSRPAETPAKA